MAEKRKVTLRTNWVDESEPFRVPGTPPSSGGQERCPSCSVPLRTSIDGTFFCWFCEKKYDSEQLKAAQAAKPKAVPPTPEVKKQPPTPKKQPVPEDDVEFEIDIDEDVGPVGIDATDPEPSPEEDEGTEEEWPEEEGVGSDLADEDVEFEVEENEGSEGPEDSGGKERAETLRETEGEAQGDKVENSDNEEDIEPIEEVEEEEEEAEWTMEEEVDKEVQEERAGGKGEEDVHEEMKDDEAMDFEMELDTDQGPDEVEPSDEKEGGDAGDDPVPRHKVKKRFVDESEVEFDP